MKDRRPPGKEGPQRRGVKSTELSKRQVKPKGLKNRSRLSPISVLIPLALIFFALGAVGEDTGRQISSRIVGDIATLESAGSDANDVLLYEVDMPEGAIRASHTNPRGQWSEMIFRLLRVVVMDDDDGTLLSIGDYQIADSSYSAETHNVVLEGVGGEGLEVQWHFDVDSKLKLHLELFEEKVVHEGVEYGPASALIRFELDYPGEGSNLEISLEAEVLASQEDLSWQVGTDLVEISSSLPSSFMRLGLDKEIHHDNNVEGVLYSYAEILDGISLTADLKGLEESHWGGIFEVDIFPFDGEEVVWHPSADVVSFGITALVTAVAVTLLKLRFSRL